MIVNPIEFLNENPVFLDTETSGIATDAEIIEICIIENNGEVVLDSLIKPVNPVPENATAIHGISNEMLEDAPTWPDIWPVVKHALSGRWVGIYNAEFDVRLIKQTHEIAGLKWEPLGAKAICIMEAFARFIGDWSDYHQSYRRHKLENAGKHFDIKIPNSHRAKDDTELARQVLMHVASKIEVEA